MTVYEIVTNRVIEQLEAGIIPWKRPWCGSDLAYNRVSKKSYSLLNQLLLSKPGEWATFKQWSTLGGKVKKGEKGEVVVFWKIDKSEDPDTHRVTSFPILRYYKVFHISQVEGVDSLEANPGVGNEPIDEAERVIADYVKRSGVKFVEQTSGRAFYRPSEDMVVVPKKEQFSAIEEYYSTSFHELVHSTGHKSRLDRLTTVAAFGSDVYSKEELVAEIGSASILALIGIETEQTATNSTAYLVNWLGALKNDPYMIVSAASRAEKAVKMIMGTESE